MRYALIGKTLGHSYSADIHKAFGNQEYELAEVKESDLPGLLREKDFAGLNVTIPYKQAVYPFLEGIDAIARDTGSINTVLNREGHLYGYNTDLFGFEATLARFRISLKGKTVAILGTGGAAKTVRYAAKKAGADNVYLVSRTGKEGALNYEQLHARRERIEVLINATPVGTYPSGGNSPVELDDYHFLTAVIDLIYNPLFSELLCQAREKEIPAVGGLYMLVAQAAKAEELFGNGPFSEEDIERVYREILRKKQNIVLTGMPTAGKTDTGKAVARILGRPVLDTDGVINALRDTTPRKIMETEGVARFRAYEKDVVISLSQAQGLVISLGGGALLDPDNVRAMRKNGMIFFLDKPLEELKPDKEHPLSDTRERMAALYEARFLHYRQVTDKQIPTGGLSYEEAAKAVLAEWEK